MFLIQAAVADKAIHPASDFVLSVAKAMTPDEVISEHRRFAAARAAQRAQDVFRLRRGRLLQSGDAAGQPGRFREDQAPPAHPGRCRQARHLDHHHRREGAAAAGARPDRAWRHDARRRRNPRVPGGAGGRHSLHTLHHVDQFDRGRGGRSRQAVLVSALRHARPRLHARAHRARGGRQVQRADADGRSAGARPAPLRRAQRPDRAARNQDQEPYRHRHQAGLGAFHPQGQAQDVRQSRRTREGMEGINSLAAWTASQFDPYAELEGHRVDQEPVAGQVVSSRASSTSKTRGSRPRPAWRAQRSPTTAAGSSTARRHRSRRCRASWRRSARRSR